MSDFAAMVGSPSPNSTGPLTVGARHRSDDGLWPAVICLGRGLICEWPAAGQSMASIRLEMTPVEARTFARDLLVMASRVE